jgi:hypothetical protein
MPERPSGSVEQPQEIVTGTPVVAAVIGPACVTMDDVPTCAVVRPARLALGHVATAGGATGVTALEANEGVPVPAALVAVTVNV